MENVKASKDYSKGKIYVIRNTVNDKVYIGSTTQPLCKRMAGHREVFRKKTNQILYNAMNEHGVDNFYIELLEEHPCENLEQLRKREGEFIREYKSFDTGYNQRIAGRNKKQWYNDNIETAKQREKQYRDAHKQDTAQRSKTHYEENKDEIHTRQKQYRQENKPIIQQQNKEYYAKNKDTIKQKRQTRINCPHCGLEMCKDSIYKHMKYKHPTISHN
jgi:group I intron endonuclease